MRTYNDFLTLTFQLCNDHFLSKLEPEVRTKVMAVNTCLFRDEQILNLLSTLYKFSLHTLKHLFNTQITTCYLCIKERLDKQDTDNLLISALLHDVGKLLIPSPILCKTTHLTNSEWHIMKNHPLYSVQLLNPFGLSPTILHMVQYHHVCYNGNGYPEYGISPLMLGSQEHKKMWTSLGYLTMADAFDAMYHDRSYRPSCHMSYIRAEIAACASEQFAPKPADIMLKALSNLSMREETVLC